MMTVTYSTILDSLKLYSGLVDEEHHHAIALSNISVSEYQELKQRCLSVGEKENITEKISNYAELIIDDMDKYKIIKFKSITPVLLIPKIVKLFKSLNSLKNKKIKDTVLITDDISLFIIIHTLIIHKSFWMVFPTKNHPFLVFLIERMFDIVDKRLQDVEVEHFYEPKKDLAKIKTSKIAGKDEQKQKIQI